MYQLLHLQNRITDKQQGITSSSSSTYLEMSEINFKTCLYQHCPKKVSVTLEIFIFILSKRNSYCPHVAIEYLKCDKCDWGVKLFSVNFIMDRPDAYKLPMKISEYYSLRINFQYPLGFSTPESSIKLVKRISSPSAWWWKCLAWK